MSTALHLLIMNKKQKPKTAAKATSQVKRNGAREILETLMHTFVLPRFDFTPALNETPLPRRVADLMKDLGFITANNAGHESLSSVRYSGVHRRRRPADLLGTRGSSGSGSPVS